MQLKHVNLRIKNNDFSNLFAQKKQTNIALVMKRSLYINHNKMQYIFHKKLSKFFLFYVPAVYKIKMCDIFIKILILKNKMSEIKFFFENKLLMQMEKFHQYNVTKKNN